jgi:hypothetical protein
VGILMTSMAHGAYQEPMGSRFPSVSTEERRLRSEPCGPKPFQRTSANVQVFGRRHHEGRLLLWRPASKKRQGTKSREVWGRVGSQRYGDLIFASIMTVGGKLAPGDLDRVRKGSWKRAMEISVAA